MKHVISSRLVPPIVRALIQPTRELEPRDLTSAQAGFGGGLGRENFATAPGSAPGAGS